MSPKLANTTLENALVGDDTVSLVYVVNLSVSTYLFTVSSESAVPVIVVVYCVKSVVKSLIETVPGVISFKYVSNNLDTAGSPECKAVRLSS